MVCVVTLRVKNEEKKTEKKLNIYEPFTASEDDPFLQELFRELCKEHNAPIDDASVTIKIEFVGDYSLNEPAPH